LRRLPYFSFRQRHAESPQRSADTLRYVRTNPVYILKAKLSIDKVTIYTDGAARGNPGPAAIGVVIKDETGQIINTISKRLGNTTNNQAEYRAVIAGMEKAIGLGTRHILIKSDSELVVKQLNGLYKIKNVALRPLYQEVGRLIGALESFSISYIPRAQNAAADALANKALDRA
jgi:ribonuclease HI